MFLELKYNSRRGTVWKGGVRYSVRSRIEAKIRAVKASGERIAANHPDSQTVEIQIRVA